MDWQALGALGEVIGAAGVVVTLGYLAVQVRQNTRALRGTMHDSATAQLREIEQLIVSNTAVLRVWTEGLEAPDQLEPLERARLMHLIFLLLGAFENFHYLYRIGTLDDEKWQAWRVNLQHYADAPGIRMYWEKRREMFSPAFRDLVDSLERAPGIRIGHLAGTIEEQDGSSGR